MYNPNHPARPHAVSHQQTVAPKGTGNKPDTEKNTRCLLTTYQATQTKLFKPRTRVPLNSEYPQSQTDYDLRGSYSNK